ncbi:nucleotidyltransferase domain-containing protein [Flavobacterium xinjiangense]|uniref:Nucleotidyltransferase domain-containing protein n=1 Tax=Flavobacterium xinjiangense TaxID=178356 RepID=A0A1M7N5X3_9FLAO|nr:nucleotidyltransferase domain-containing protein [Flavobacterium xinjiangense]SHM98868.1 Nucleotidyltransferase domain-containing protein [Flavobacterium xinjiangense]
MEIKHNIENVNSIRVFGSNARGDNTSYSDYDVLVVLKKSQIITSELEREIKILFENEISISWYSESRIKTLFEMGHLFAWHLYKESVPTSQNDFIEQLGKPMDYKFAEQDISSLLEILKPIQKSVNACPRNLIYEAGLLYVCIRNIAISALPVICNQYLFETHVPYKLNLLMSAKNYDLLLHARYTSTRATVKPDLNIETFNLLFKEAETWALEQLAAVKKIIYEN